MDNSNLDYDLVVIGSGPAGQRAAIQAAKLDKRVALIEQKTVLGGMCINTGTIPSKTLREAVVELTGYRSREFYGSSYTVKQKITMEDLLFRTQKVIRHEIDVVRNQLLRNRIELIVGSGSFIDRNTIRVDSIDGHSHQLITTEKVIIAVGTTATRDEHIPFDGRSIFISDDILYLDKLPRSITVIGAGVIGCEYATMFATLGVRVTLVDKRPQLLSFIDEEVADRKSVV